MTGCLKKAEPVNRDLTSKYYTPTELIPDVHLPPYFSGAGYFMSKSALTPFCRLAEVLYGLF